MRNSIVVTPFGVNHQAIISMGDVHFVVGSSMLRDTVSQPTRPNDVLLAALATDCTFACQDAFQSLDMPNSHIMTSANMSGATSVEIQMMVDSLQDVQSDAVLDYVREHSLLYRLLGTVMTITLRMIG